MTSPPSHFSTSPPMLPPPLSGARVARDMRRDRRRRRRQQAQAKSCVFVKRQKVSCQLQYGDLTLTEFDGLDCDGAPILEGTPSVGFVSMTIAKYVVETLNLPLCGVVTSSVFPVACSVYRGEPSYPVRIFADPRLVVFACDFKLPTPLLHSFVDMVYDFAERHNSSMIFTVEGKPDTRILDKDTGRLVDLCESMPPHLAAPHRMLQGPVPFLAFDSCTSASGSSSSSSSSFHSAHSASSASASTSASASDGRSGASGVHALTDLLRAEQGTVTSEVDEDEYSDSDHRDLQHDRHGKPRIHFLTTCEMTAMRLLKQDARPVIEGQIDGVTGGLLAAASLKDCHVTAILAKASSLFRDARAAASVIELLASLIPTLCGCFDTTLLIEEATDIEQHFKTLAASAPKFPGAMGMPGKDAATSLAEAAAAAEAEAAGPPPGMYM